VLCRINEDVIIRLKWGQTEYKGRLISVDSYMNVQLSNTEEYIDRKHTGTLGQVLIRYGPASRNLVECINSYSFLVANTGAITSSGYRQPKESR